MPSQIKVRLFKRTDSETGKPAAIYQMQYRDPETGRAVQRSTRTTRLRDAERAAGEWEKELLEGLDVRRGSTKWADFKQRYEDEHLAGLAEGSVRKALGVLSMYHRTMRPKDLAAVTRKTLGRYVRRLRDDGRSESTIKSHITHLRAALRWAVDAELLHRLPKWPRIQRAKRTKMMKGRPITLEEFERMLGKVDSIVGLAALHERTILHREGLKKSGRKVTAVAEPPDDAVARAKLCVQAWTHFLKGLWWSGLRLGEAIELHWTDETRLCVDLTCRHPMLRIPVECEKGHKDRLLPMAPEIAEFLLATPVEKRIGYVFDLPAQACGRNTSLTEKQVGRTICRIGEAANVKVADKPNGGVKYASAHDLRRSFGSRWAVRVMPQVLQELMRHESIETTLRYYVGRNAQQTAGILWEAYSQSAKQGASGPTEDDEAPAEAESVEVDLA